MPDNSQFVSEDFIDGKVVISGPSRTGKSEQVLNHLNALARSGERFYLILPSGDYVQRYKKLIAGSAGGYIGSSVMTLNSLVELIEEASGRRGNEEVPGYMLNHMISEIIEKAADSNQLSYFGEAAKLNSFSLELQLLFSEFLHSRLKPDDLIGLDFEGMLKQKISEIGLIYGDYLEKCRESGIGDFDIRLSNAVEILNSNEELFKDVQAVIIDGFYDYTLLQQELFNTLIGRVKNVLLTRLHDDGREKVFKFADRMKGFYEGFKEKSSKLGKWDNSPIALLRENLFEPKIGSSGKNQDIP
ncbi:MAG: UvrD-helicase domain-containing protein, partial [Candidatus Marinimicrobia bacterium]|nr:UvrD-helicase domain-containing protein [Candidatus Neomarinimicrobiota bacterium]